MTRLGTTTLGVTTSAQGFDMLKITVLVYSNADRTIVDLIVLYSMDQPVLSGYSMFGYDLELGLSDLVSG